jgi:hypothetical protein
VSTDCKDHLVKYSVFCNFHDVWWSVSPVSVRFGTFAVVNPTEKGKLDQMVFAISQASGSAGGHGPCVMMTSGFMCRSM